MKRADKFEKELKALFEGDISEQEAIDFALGLESIRRIIQERPYLKTSVDFEAVKGILFDDYRKWVRGEKECFIGTMTVRAPRILPKVGTVYGSIPMVMDELSKGTVRPEFRFAKSKGKLVPWKKFVKDSGKSEATIRNRIESGNIPDNLIEWGRRRGPGYGREIRTIHRDALKFLKN